KVLKSAKKLQAEDIKKLKIPEELQQVTLESYNRIIRKGKVAVRSSATIEDSKTHSYAGTFRTDIFIRKNKIFESIKAVYVSLYKAAIDESKLKSTKMAVVIQKQINSQKSGVLFITKDYIIINAILGQGERLVSGKEVGDIYKVNLGKNRTEISKIIKLQRSANLGGHNITLSSQVSYAQKLLNNEIKMLIEASMKVYRLFDSPQDIEWCISNNKVYILQSRPITSSVPDVFISSDINTIPVSEGIGRGIPWRDVKHIPNRPVILTVDEIELKDIKYLRNKMVAGIITHYDGMLSHVGILARELGIPYITGVSNIRDLLHASNIYMDGYKGKIVIADGKSITNLSGTGFATYRWVHKDLNNLVYIRNTKSLIRRLDKFVIIYPNDEEILPKGLSKYIRLIGPADIYTSYGLLFRCIDANVEGIDLLKKGIVESLNSLDTLSLEHNYAMAKSAILNYYSIAKEAYSRYKSDNKKDDLVKAYVNSVMSYIYFNTIRNAALDYAEYVFGTILSNKHGLVTDTTLYHDFNDINRGKLLQLRKKLIWILDDVSKAVGEGKKESAIDFEERVAAELQKSIGKLKYYKVVKSNFG
ncbi:MAG: PEP/pyruvate-binding domain-containing protein, partial [Candidatus Micrarchaeaceae archaeon]